VEKQVIQFQEWLTDAGMRQWVVKWRLLGYRVQRAELETPDVSWHVRIEGARTLVLYKRLAQGYYLLAAKVNGVAWG
jgi:hypothetical protein